jgi:hypothetical protein
LTVRQAAKDLQDINGDSEAEDIAFMNRVQRSIEIQNILKVLMEESRVMNELIHIYIYIYMYIYIHE